MKIGIDARLINETGIGRYIRNLIDELVKLDNTNDYVIFLRENEFLTYTSPNKRWSARLSEVPWHTIKEQFVMPYIFMKEKLDVLHVPYFNIPIFYPGRMLVTIHDLIILHFNTGRASTLPPMLYGLKRLAYTLLLAVGLQRVYKIIAVSNATKQDIIKNFKIPNEKIVVTYEGVDNTFTNQKLKIKDRLKHISTPYILYVGNAYPHKNIATLINTFENIQKKYSNHDGSKSTLSKNVFDQNDMLLQNYKLILVGPHDYFYEKYKRYIMLKHLDSTIIFYGPAYYNQLIGLYSHASALVFPSLMEGFGLPGIEAMAEGIPVVASNIEVFHEIYGECVTYFDPYSWLSLKQSLIRVLFDKKYVQQHVEKGRLFVQKYRWDTMTKQTMSIYEHTT
jgi:glycosyltransferase involved in cell wall biosynthesis